MPTNESQIPHESIAAVLHVNTLLRLAEDFHPSDRGTNLLSVPIALWHIEFNILKRHSLCDLPINGKNICIRICACDIHLEISNATHKVICVEIPESKVLNMAIRYAKMYHITLLCVCYVDIRCNYTQTHKNCGCQDGRIAVRYREEISS